MVSHVDSSLPTTGCPSPSDSHRGGCQAGGGAREVKVDLSRGGDGRSGETPADVGRVEGSNRSMCDVCSLILRCLWKYKGLMSLHFLSSSIQVWPRSAVSQILINELGWKSSPYVLELYYTWTFFVFNFKALYGVISDSFPIGGSRRKPYLIFNYFLLSVGYVLFGVFIQTTVQVFIGGILLSLALAFEQAVLDAATIELIRLKEGEERGEVEKDTEVDDEAESIERMEARERERKKSIVDFQCAAMYWRTLGSLLTTVVAGAAAKSGISSRAMVASNGVWPALAMILVMLLTLDDRKEARAYEATLEALKVFKRCLSDRTQFTHRVRQVLTFLGPCLFIFVYASTPSSGTAYYSFIFTLGFSLSQQYWLNLSPLLGSLFGASLYWLFCRESKLPKVFIISSLVSLLAGLTQVILVQKWNATLHISDFTFLVLDQFLVAAARSIAFLPVLVLAARAASETQSEGFVYAFLISFNNWGGTMSGLFSAALMKGMEVTSENDHQNLWKLIVLCQGVGLVPLLLLPLLKWVEKKEVASREDGRED